jgi:repressor LexA
MYGMSLLTPRQQEILDFVQQKLSEGLAPSAREIAKHFGFRTASSVTDHLNALRRKGVLNWNPHQARSLRLLSPLQEWRRPVVDIPVFGSIPAGLAEDRVQDAARGCISIDVHSLGIRVSTRTFALEVRGDSMIGKHILEGDYAVFEHGVSPRMGDVVAALIDNESTLKTFLMERGKPYLRAENPKYPKLIPAQELVIQGVMVALIRKWK